MKWERCYADDGANCIAGYKCGEFAILKRVSIASASCCLDDQGSERASSWDLFQKKTFLGSFQTLYEAKEAAFKPDKSMAAHEKQTEEANARRMGIHIPSMDETSE